MSETSVPNPTADTGADAKRGRYWLRLGVIVAVVAGALFLLVQHGPGMLARYLARNYFQGVNIDVSGVDTLDIDLLAGRVKFGPVTFRSGGSEAEAGQVGRLGVDIDLSALFRKRASLASVVIEGIRLDVHQSADGELAFNGIPLRQILGEQAETTTDRSEPPAPEAEEVEPGWGVGLDALELRDSRLVFTDAKGGQATIHVDELDLQGFRTWTADNPGTFRLVGSLNDMRIAARGQATPLSSNVRIDSRIDLTGITIPRIETYTGPLGFAPNDGTLDLSLASKGSAVFPDGRVDGQLDVRVSISEIHAARPDIGAFELASGTIVLPALNLTYDGVGSIGLSGSAEIAFDETDVRLADGTRVAGASLRANLQDLVADLSEDGAHAVTAQPTLVVDTLELGGPHIEGSIGSTRIELSAFAFDPGRVAMLATGKLDVEKLDLNVPLRKPIGIGMATFNGEVDGTEFVFGDQTSIRGPIAATADGVEISVAMKEPRPQQPTPALRITTGRLSAQLPEFFLDEPPEATKIRLGGPVTSLEAFTLTTPIAPGSDLDIRADVLTLNAPDLDLSDGATLSIGMRADVTAPELALAYRKVPPAGVDTVPLIGIVFKEFAFGMDNLAYGENGPALNLGMGGLLSSDRLEVELAADTDQPQTAVTLSGLELNLADVGYGENPPKIDWHAKLDLASQRLDMKVDEGRRAAAMITDIKLDGADASSRPHIAFGRLNLGTLKASIVRPKATAQATPEKATAKSESEADEEKKQEKEWPWPPPGLPELRIGQVALLDGGRVEVVDQTPSPPIKSVLNIRTLALVNLDSTRPQEVSDLRLDASLDDGAITVDGWTALFRPKPDFSVNARVDQLGLRSLSPYVAPEIGLDLIGGTLRASSHATAEAARLDGEVEMTIKDAAFADRPGIETDEVSRSIGLPLNTIIDLLEDPDGTIDLVIPFEGDLLSPDFDLSQVFWTGFWRVLRALVTAPFKLISASVSLMSGKDAGAGAGSPFTIDPFAFQPGTAILDQSLSPRIEGLAQVLEDRPRLVLKICGVASGQDLPASAANPPSAKPAEVPSQQRAEMARLAQQRMIAFTDQLAELGGIRSDRIQHCPEPRVDPNDIGPPRVEVRF